MIRNERFKSAVVDIIDWLTGATLVGLFAMIAIFVWLLVWFLVKNIALPMIGWVTP